MFSKLIITNYLKQFKNKNHPIGRLYQQCRRQASYKMSEKSASTGVTGTNPAK
jgi:hypothetical protein